jgi:hypothetical protein
MKSSISRAPITASTGLSDSAQIVRGATNLTTVNAIPYVSSSGVLNLDASNFFWDATNHRLGIGTNAPASPLDVSISNAAAGLLKIKNTSATGFASFDTYTSADVLAGGFGYGNASAAAFAGKMYLYTATKDLQFSYNSGTTIAGVMLSTGVWGFGKGNTSPTGTLHVYDATASTGATTLTVKAGARQSTTNLQEWQNSSGTVLTGVSSAGNLFAGTSGYATLPIGGFVAAAALMAVRDSGIIVTRGAGGFFWENGANNPATGTLDTSLSRISAGIVGVGTGAAGSVAGTLQAATLQVLGNGSASNPMLLGSGTWFTGGLATTTKPYMLIEPSGTTSNNWNTAGTGIGVNAASGYAGNMMDLQIAGVRVMAVTNSGTVLAATHLNNPGTAALGSSIFVGNATPIAFSSTSAWNGSPDTSLSRVSAGVVGVGTGAAGSVAGEIRAATGTLTNAAIAGEINFATQVRMSASASGSLQIRDNAGTSFSLLQFGGTSSSFPSLKRSTTGIVARLADDSADTWIKVKSVITSALTVATLPASPTAGERAFVTDSNAVSFTAGIGAVVASGGSTAVPVVYDGTSWRIG